MLYVGNIGNYLDFKSIGNFLISTWQGRLILGGIAVYLAAKDKIHALFHSVFAGGDTLQAGNRKLRFASSINPDNPDETYVRITLDPPKETAKKADFIFAISERSSMNTKDMLSKNNTPISRWESVLEGIKEVAKFGADFKVSFLKLDTKLQHRFVQIKSGDVAQKLEGLSFTPNTRYAKDWDIRKELEILTSSINSLPDSQTPRELVFVFDGNDHKFNFWQPDWYSERYDDNCTPFIQKFQEACESKNITVHVVGMSEAHDPLILQRIISVKDYNLDLYMPNSRYYFISGKPVTENSPDQGMRATFSQVMEEIRGSKAPAEMSLSLDCESDLLGDEKTTYLADYLYRLGNCRQIILKVNTDVKPCLITFNAEATATHKHHLNPAVNNDVLCTVIESELKEALRLARMTKLGGSPAEKRQRIEECLARSAKLNPKSQDILALEKMAQSVLTSFDSGQPIDQAITRAVFGMETRHEHLKID